MAKRKKAAGASSDEKYRLEVRFDPAIGAGIRKLAEQAGVSVNQLLEALAQWAVVNGQVGEPVRDGEGFLGVHEVPGVVTIARLGDYSGYEEAYEHMGPPSNEREANYLRALKGTVFVTLDFTVRRVLRDGVEFEQGGEAK